MKKITILALNGAAATGITGPMDVFHLSDLNWGYTSGREPVVHFQVRIASMNGKAARCANRLYIEPHCSVHEVKDTDLIIIPALSDFVDQVVAKNDGVIDWLVQQYRLGSQIASICTGAFVLAQTGLLNGKTATTHWGFVDLFRQRYPLVCLRPECLVTDEGDLYCSGGSNACFDLSLYLVEKLCGREVAVQYARVMVHDLGRITQSPYVMTRFKKDHNDPDILKVQQWTERHYDEAIRIPDLARRHGMSQRSFERRFKQATGDSPLLYLQKVRIEAAKGMLEKRSATFEEVTYRVGYGDIRSFRKIFQRHTGLRPKEYQRIYQPHPLAQS